MPRSDISAILAALVLLGCSNSQEPEPASRIGSITFSEDSVAIDPGGQYTPQPPEARDTSGVLLSGISYVWRSADPDIATVDGVGRITGVAVGTTEVTASAEGVSGALPVAVIPSALALLELIPADLELLPGSAVQIVAQFRDTAGRPNAVSHGEVLWSSSDPATVSLRQTQNPAGPPRVVANALRTGQAVVTAHRGPLSASVTMTIAPEPFITVAAGGTHACAITASRRTYCWGGASEGQLGGGLPDLQCEFTFCSTMPLLVHGSERFERVALGPGHTCGLTGAADLFCWGGGPANDMRPGGSHCFEPDLDPVLLCLPEPARVEPGVLAAAAAPGRAHGCALDTSGVIRCWGDARQARLGTLSALAECIEHQAGSVDFYACSPEPIGIEDPGPFTLVAAGDDHTCALTPPGEVRCWGSNTVGQLGRGPTSPGELPAPVIGGLRFDRVSAGGNHSCALSAGVAYCWGSNRFGQLGTTLETSCAVTEPAACEPVMVEGHLFTGISAGTAHTCALESSGAAWCWGRNDLGELGNGTTESSVAPVPVSGGLFFREISAGAGTTCGIGRDGVAYCWGLNLGNGEPGPGRPMPTRVPGQP